VQFKERRKSVSSFVFPKKNTPQVDFRLATRSHKR